MGEQELLGPPWAAYQWCRRESSVRGMWLAESAGIALARMRTIGLVRKANDRRADISVSSKLLSPTA